MSRIALVAIGVLFSGTALATTYTVDNHTYTNSEPECKASTQPSIQAAIIAAKAGDTINVCPGTYTEALYITRPLYLNGIESDENHLITVKPTAGQPTTTLYSGGAASVVILVDNTPKVYISNIVADDSLATQGCSNTDSIDVY